MGLYCNSPKAQEPPHGLVYKDAFLNNNLLPFL